MGVDFVGFRIWSTHRRLKKKTAVKIKRNLKNQIAKVKTGEERKDRLDRSVASYRGILSHFDSYGLRQSLHGLIAVLLFKSNLNSSDKNALNSSLTSAKYFLSWWSMIISSIYRM